MASKKNKKLIRKSWLVFRNKYFLAGFSLLIWLSFFDRNDFISQYQYHCKLHDLEKEQAYYREQILQTQKDMQELLGNPKNLEKYAREQYRMKKDDEDVFVVMHESQKEKS
jgi:cell division protein FtsB